MPGPTTLQYPLINGMMFDHSSVETNLAGTIFGAGAIKSIQYKQKLEPGMARGNNAYVIGRARGKYDADGKLEVWKREYDYFMGLLQATAPALGLMEIAFDIMVTRAEVGQPPIVDTLLGCRITEDDETSQEGDPNSVSLSIHIMRLIKNGRAPVSPAKFGL